MHENKINDLSRSYVLHFRHRGVVGTEVLRNVEPERLEKAVAERLKELGCTARDTQILRLETSHATAYAPSLVSDIRHFEWVAQTLELRADELEHVLAVAWGAAVRTYRSRVGERYGRRYVVHDFEGSLDVQADSGRIAAQLTCLHPALTTDARDLFSVIGEARLDLWGVSLVLEFAGEIDRAGADRWRCVTIDHRGSQAPDDFLGAEWLVVESATA